MEITDKKARRILQILIAIFIIVSLGIIIIAGIYYSNYQKHHITGVEEQLSLIASLKVSELEQYKKERFDDVKVFFKNEYFSKVVENYITDVNNPNSKKVLNTWLSNFNETKKYDKITLFDTDSNPIFMLPDTNKLVSEHVFNKIKIVGSIKEIIFDDFYINDKNNKIYLNVFVPILSENQKRKTIGVIAFRINPETYLYPLLSKWPIPTLTGETLLIEGRKNEVVFLNNLKFNKHAALKLKIPLSKRNIPAVEAMHKKTGIFLGNDYRGVEVVSYIKKVSKSPWYLIAKIDQSEINGPLISRLRQLVFLIFVFIGGTGFGLGFIWKRQIASFMQKKINDSKALEISEFRLSRAEKVAGFGNWEIDLNNKTVYASDGAVEIYGFNGNNAKLEEILVLPLSEYREKLDKELKDLITHHKPYSIEFKIKRSSDNKIIDIHSTAVYNAEQNKVFGVIQDITYRKINEENLRKTEERLRLALEAGSEGIWDWDIKNNTLYWSPRAFMLLGYEYNEFELDYKKWADLVHPDDKEKTFTLFNDKINSDYKNFIVEYRLKKKTGGYLWVKDSGNGTKSDNNESIRILGTRTDINGRKLAELELKKIEWMLSKKSIQHIQLNDFEQEYTDLTELNKDGLIKNSIAKDLLYDISNDYLKMLETSSSINEINGDFAFGVFSSKWCRFLDNASFTLCGAKSVKDADNCEKWLCHQSCRKNISKLVGQTRQIVDIKCAGGLGLYAVPIFAGRDVVGSISFAYGDPPKDKETLNTLAEKYNVNIEKLAAISSSYDSRPEYIIDLAKERLESSSRLISALVERTKTEKELFENQEKYKSLIESSGSVIVLSDYNGLIIYLNNIAANSFHQSAENLIGKNLEQLFPPEVYNGYISNIRHVIDNENGIIEESESFILGKSHWFRASIQPVKNSDGKINAALINSTDITEQKIAEEKLKESQSQFIQFMHHLPAGAFIKDENSKTIFVNKFLEDAFNAQTWIGRSPKEMFPSEIGEAMMADDKDAIEKKYKRVIEFVPHNDGKIHFYETHKFAILREGLDSLLGGIALDITERKQAEESLREMRLRQEAILAAVPDIIIEVDINKFYTWVNKAGLEFFGKNIVGEPAIKYSINQNDIFKFDYQINNNKSIYYVEDTHYRADKTERIFGWWCKLLFDEDGILKGCLATARDITEMKKNEMEIKTLNAELDKRVMERTAQLESANKELEAFTYSVSHDLRSPLRAIDGFSRILLEDYTNILDPEGIRLFNVIRTNTQKMDQLITDLLLLSRVNRGDLNLLPINMTALVERIYYENIQEETRQKFEFTLHPLLEFRGDEILFRQVWVNLISNAIKYTLPKGSRQIEIGSYLQNMNIIYYIKDSGVGFNPEYAGKLFGVFQRLHKTEEFEGTGVGLAVVKRIIERHGGTIWAESKLNEGATFYISVPKW